MHMAQLMPLPLTVCCFSKIQIGLTFLVPAYPGSPGQKTNCVCVCYAFSALTLLVWWLKEHPACKNWLMRYWCGYPSGARCRLFAYGPADATAIPKPHHVLPHLNPDWFYLSGTGIPKLSWKKSQLNVCHSSILYGAVLRGPSHTCYVCVRAVWHLWSSITGTISSSLEPSALVFAVLK